MVRADVRGTERRRTRCPEATARRPGGTHGCSPATDRAFGNDRRTGRPPWAPARTLVPRHGRTDPDRGRARSAAQLTKGKIAERTGRARDRRRRGAPARAAAPGSASTKNAGTRPAVNRPPARRSRLRGRRPRARGAAPRPSRLGGPRRGAAPFRHPRGLRMVGFFRMVGKSRPYLPTQFSTTRPSTPSSSPSPSSSVHWPTSSGVAWSAYCESEPGRRSSSPVSSACRRERSAIT